ncbi:Hydroxypyruvate isomerase [Geobacillus stearothermophilus]|uniref:Hydroxypyruvate isomerase n=1 Tax=Geobacillus stearothermophilus TaxID=1422 RepID=A0A150NAZ5_GEOSE|nr:Hydroxypyruvate isomerase [Geobacillus stearothermophilus]
MPGFAKAKQHGFSHVECQFPYAAAPEAVAAELEEYGLSLVTINLPAGDWEKGERGLAILPGRHDDFRRALEEGVRYALALGAPRLHCMAGVVPADLPRERAKEIYMRRLDEAAAALGVHGLTLTIEPINPFDMPGYFLTDIDEVVAIIRALGRANVKVQYDIYHMARLGRDVTATFAAYEPLIDHVQFADAPGRHEPGTGALVGEPENRLWRHGGDFAGLFSARRRHSAQPAAGSVERNRQHQPQIRASDCEYFPCWRRQFAPACVV